MPPQISSPTWNKKNISRQLVPCFLLVPFQTHMIYTLKEETFCDLKNCEKYGINFPDWQINFCKSPKEIHFSKE